MAQTPDLVNKRSVHILSNRPTLEPVESFAVCFDPWFITGRAVKILKGTERRIELEILGQHGEALIVNESRFARILDLRLVRKEQEVSERRVLVAGEEWKVKGMPSAKRL